MTRLPEWLRCRPLLLRQRGQALVELALVAPILAVLILGTVEFGNALNSYISLVNASREGSRLAARGSIFQPSEVLQVVEQHAGGLDLAGSGSVVLTTVHSDSSTGTFTVTAATLLGSEHSRFDQAGLQTLYNQATSSDPDTQYLRKERLVILEAFYQHHTILGGIDFLGFQIPAQIPMYTYTMMPVSAPS